MKRLTIIIALSLLSGTWLTAQVSINTDNSQPDPSAMLDVKSSSKGVLLPRVTYEQRNAIQDPVEGLMLFCTNCNFDGSGVLCIFQNG